jgi:membrane protease subunit (stomatin/prohibitin family)
MRRRGLGRRGGLLGMAARTAVVAGTATAVSNKVSRHQQGADRAEDAQSAGSGNPDRITQLERLNELKKSGAVSAEEFEREKAKLPH